MYNIDLYPGEALLIIKHNEGYIKELRDRHDEYVKTEYGQILFDQLIADKQKRIAELKKLMGWK